MQGLCFCLDAVSQAHAHPAAAFCCACVKPTLSSLSLLLPGVLLLLLLLLLQVLCRLT
jgi:hypothetical protein